MEQTSGSQSTLETAPRTEVSTREDYGYSEEDPSHTLQYPPRPPSACSHVSSLVGDWGQLSLDPLEDEEIPLANECEVSIDSYNQLHELERPGSAQSVHSVASLRSNRSTAAPCEAQQSYLQQQEQYQYQMNELERPSSALSVHSVASVHSVRSTTAPCDIQQSYLQQQEQYPQHQLNELERPGSALSVHSVASVHSVRSTTAPCDIQQPYLQQQQEQYPQNHLQHVIDNSNYNISNNNGYPEDSGYQNGTINQQTQHSMYHDLNEPLNNTQYDTHNHHQTPVPGTPVPGTPIPPSFSRPSSACSNTSSMAGEFPPHNTTPRDNHNGERPYNQQGMYNQMGNYRDVNNYYSQGPPNANYQQPPYPQPNYNQSYYQQQNPYYGVGSGPNVGYYNNNVSQMGPNYYQYPGQNRIYEPNPQSRFNMSGASQRSFDMNMSFGSMPGGYGPGNMPPEMQDWVTKYTQWWYKMYYSRNQKRGERQRLTPLAFQTTHSRISFGSRNTLVVVSGNSVLLQQLDYSTIDAGAEVTITTWPGPLVKEQADKNEILEYIRTQESVERPVIIGKELETYYYNHQKRQIWQLLLMLVRQNGVVSGSDLAELIITNNETEFQTDDEGSHISKFRKYLMYGQKKTAIDFASKHGLWGHALALTYLTSPKECMPSSNPSQMINLITKFIHSELSHDDPIYVLYRCLLQKHQDFYLNQESKSVPISNLQQFAILLANDCEVTPKIFTGNNLNTDLLKCIVALRNNEAQHFINHASIVNENDCCFSEETAFINEIFEFSRNWHEVVFDLVPYKLLLAAKLFDFGLLSQSQKYCEIIRNTYDYYCNYFGQSPASHRVNWTLIIKLVDELENRISGKDVPQIPRQASLSETAQGHTETEKGAKQSTAQVLADIEEKVAVNEKTDVVSELPLASANQWETQSIGKANDAPSRKPSLAETVSSEVSRTLPVEVPQKKLAAWRQRKPSVSERSVASEKEVASYTPPSTPQDTFNLPQPKLNFFVPPEPNPNDGVPDFISTSAPQPQNNEDSKDDYYNQAASSHSNFNSTADNFASNRPSFSPTLSPIGPPRLSTESKEIKATRIDESQQRPFGGESYQQRQPQQLQEQKPTPDVNKRPEAGRPKGFLDSIFSKFVPAGPPKAILPDDKNPKIVWDENLKQWVDKDSNNTNDVNTAALNGPPKIPLMPQAPVMSGPPQAPPMAQQPTFQQPLMPALNPAQLRFTKSKQKRYVDILQQQQQKS